MTNDRELEFLPEDVQFEILLWLPVVSLVRFKSVCKSWCSHIQTSFFISQHKERGKYFNCDQDSFIVLTGTHDLVDESHYLTFSVISNFEVSENLNVPPGFRDNYYVSSGEMVCCDGIVCLLKEFASNFTLWNPATRQFRLLPKTHLPLGYWQKKYFGFGFDSNTDDYKVVKFICPRDHDSEINNQVEVYSLNNDSWISLDLAFPIIYGYIVSHPGAPYPTNGTTYYCWLGWRDEYPMVDDENIDFSMVDNENIERVWEILSFDFTTQVFGTIPLPNDPSFNTILCFSCSPHLTILRDNIACINILGPSIEMAETGDFKASIDVWVLNEFGSKESWTRQYRVGPFYFAEGVGLVCQSGIGLSKIGDSFLHVDDGQFWLCNLVTHERKRLSTIPDITNRSKFVVYKESLLSVESRKECKPSSMRLQ